MSSGKVDSNTALAALQQVSAIAVRVSALTGIDVLTIADRIRRRGLFIQ